MNLMFNVIQEFLTIFICVFSKENNESDKIFGNISFVEMKFSKSISYLTNMCWTGQGPMLVAFVSSFLVGCNLWFGTQSLSVSNGMDGEVVMHCAHLLLFCNLITKRVFASDKSQESLLTSLLLLHYKIKCTPFAIIIYPNTFA